jgi:hypothetical protein
MRLSFVGYVISLGLVACSGGAPYDFPSGSGAGQSPPPPAATGNSPPPPSGQTPPPPEQVDASVPRDAGGGEDATVDAGSGLDGSKDAHADASKDAGKDAAGTCSSETDCPLLQACLINDTPPKCGTNNDCSNGGLCNGGCCNAQLFFGDTCLSGTDDTACGAPGTQCIDCASSGQTCVQGQCQ